MQGKAHSFLVNILKTKLLSDFDIGNPNESIGQKLL